MTEDARQLRALAKTYAAQLTARGYLAVAATGSTARGDAIVGSDLDLWAIAEQGNEIFHDSIGGRSVTVFAQSLEHALTPSNLSLFDVDSLWVIADPQRLFGRVRATYRKLRKQIFAGIFDATVREVLTCLQRSRSGSALGRLIYLREAALRIAALDVGRREGLRVPRYRHFSAAYRGRTLADLRVALGVEGCTPHDVRSITQAAEPYATALSGWFAERLPEAAQVRVPIAALRRLEAGDLEEGLLALRARFEQQCLIPLRAVERGEMIEAIGRLPGPVGAFLTAIQLANASGRALNAERIKTRTALDRFLRASGMNRYLSAAFYLSAEAALDRP